MREMWLARLLVATGIGVSDGWDHRRKHDHPGNPSDHRHDHGSHGG